MDSAEGLSRILMAHDLCCRLTLYVRRRGSGGVGYSNGGYVVSGMQRDSGFSGEAHNNGLVC